MAQQEQPVGGRIPPARQSQDPPHDERAERAAPLTAPDESQPARDRARAKTMVDHGRTDVIGPSAREAVDETTVTDPDAIHDSSRGATYRAGEPKPEHVKWYLGQGGITGTRSGTPFATSDPQTTRDPGDPPPKGWDPASTSKVDEGIAGGEARKDRAPGGAARKSKE